jgi:hypothetical protein
MSHRDEWRDDEQGTQAQTPCVNQLDESPVTFEGSSFFFSFFLFFFSSQNQKNGGKKDSRPTQHSSLSFFLFSSSL